MSSTKPIQGPPYAPTGALLGGIPTTSVDVPISASILALFVISAVFHITIFQRNRIAKRFFVPSALCFGLSMARIVTLIMRIVWATHHSNVSVAIAANVFAQAGVVVLFVANLILAHRTAMALLAPSYPRIMRPASILLPFFIFLVIVMVITAIVPTVYSFYTLDVAIRKRCRTAQLVATTCFAALAFLPIPIVLGALATPRPAGTRSFGAGSMRTRYILLLGSATLLTLGAAYRVGVAYKVPSLTPASWQVGRAPFYVFSFTIEIIVMYMYGVTRFDRRFFVEDWKTAETPMAYDGGGVGEKALEDDAKLRVGV